LGFKFFILKTKNMKKYLLLLLSLFLIGSVSITQIEDGDDPYIMVWSIASDEGINLKVTGGTPYTGQNLSPTVNESINAGYPYKYVLFSSLDVEIWTGASGGGQLLGSTTINMVTKDGNTYPLDSKNLITLKYNPSKSSYGATPWDNRNWFDITYNDVPPPSVITNEDWNNGLGNNDSKAVTDESFFVADYGDETGRWAVDDGAIYQSTELIEGNTGSRIYAVKLEKGDSDWTYEKGTGVAMDGLWQIDVRIGSNGGVLNTKDTVFCETFYLAERRVLKAGVDNYIDGNKTAPTNPPGREIDILETKWKPGGPQISLANDEGNTYWNKTEAQNIQMGVWDSIGGAPNPKFATYGALIRDNNLWIYAYKPDGTIWYSTDSIPNTNTEYVQEGPFVPYIGTWNEEKTQTAGDFKTGYNNFIYLAADDDKIKDKNPKDHPEAFGPVLNQ
tara:strand:- start:2423 stop:3760 length:1338 start_codon:yes stop_codon:yes gene_type:complete